MNDELVRRLRLLANCDARAGEPMGKAMREAAARIEALEAERDEAREERRWAYIQGAFDESDDAAITLDRALSRAETAETALAASEAKVRELEDILRTVAFRAQDAKRLAEDRHPVSAYNLASGILGQIGGHVATLTGEKP